MIFHDPNTVTSPRDFIESVEVIFNGGINSFSIAKIVWEGENRIAMRWNVARREYDDQRKIDEELICVGMPSSHGYPVWFVLPEDLFDRNSKAWGKLEPYLDNLK